jgi:antitoxin CcdA
MAAKKAVHLSIDAELAAEAKAAGTNMSALPDKALREKLRERGWRKWREDNRAALEAYDRHIEEDGLWANECRTWQIRQFDVFPSSTHLAICAARGRAQALDNRKRNHEEARLPEVSSPGIMRIDNAHGDSHGR